MTNETADAILRLIETEKPESVAQLVKLAKRQLQVPEKEITQQILRLQDEGKIVLRNPKSQTKIDLKPYLKTESAYWYWSIILLAVITTIATLTIPPDAFPIVYVRYILGAAFVLYLPGYTFVRALFPKWQTTKHYEGELDLVIRLALSIALSLALVPIIGLLLNYTPWGITLTPIVLSLLTATTVFSTIAVVREHQFPLSTSKLVQTRFKEG